MQRTCSPLAIDSLMAVLTDVAVLVDNVVLMFIEGNGEKMPDF